MNSILEKQQPSKRNGMSNKARWIVSAMILALVMTVGPQASAQDQAKQDQTKQDKNEEYAISLEIRDSPLKTAVQMITQESKIQNVVFIASDKYQPVTVKLEKLPIRRALQIIAEAAGAELVENDGVYRVQPRGYQSQEQPVKPKAPVVETPKRPRQWTSIALRYAVPGATKRLLEGQISGLMDDDITYQKMKADKMSRLEISGSAPVTFNPYLVDSANGNGNTGSSGGQDAAGQFGGGGRGQGGGFGGGGRGQGGGFGGGGGGFGGAGGGGGFGGAGGAGGFGGAGGGAGGAGGGQNSLTPPGVTRIIANDADNSLLVEGDTAGIEELKALLRLLDVAPKQVLIKAEFVTVNINDAENFGINWKIQPARNLDASFAGTSGTTPTVNLAYASGNAVASLRAAATRNTANIVQSPIIATTNNTEGSITNQTQVPFSQTTQFITPNGGISTNNIINFIPVTTQLSVIPHINGDGTVSMVLPLQLSAFSFVNTGTTQSVQTSSQTLVSYRRIKSGDTAVLGGFITEQINRNNTDIPVLSKLPIVGNLFRSHDTTKIRQEVLVFITPIILEDGDDAGGAGFTFSSGSGGGR
jgi:general secretion pathway protein D